VHVCCHKLVALQLPLAWTAQPAACSATHSQAQQQLKQPCRCAASSASLYVMEATPAVCACSQADDTADAAAQRRHCRRRRRRSSSSRTVHCLSGSGAMTTAAASSSACVARRPRSCSRLGRQEHLRHSNIQQSPAHSNAVRPAAACQQQHGGGRGACTQAVVYARGHASWILCTHLPSCRVYALVLVHACCRSEMLVAS
jgi:hypothetical protein